MKRIVFDIDGTLTISDATASYSQARPHAALIARLREYRDLGFEIVLYTSRNMRTYACNVGKIAAFTLPALIEWLDRHEIPYDEVHIGKPWCGHEGFYVDDRAVRPSEFLKFGKEELDALLAREKPGPPAEDPS
jgi:capsule biosynthesis phosphatase